VLLWVSTWAMLKEMQWGWQMVLQTEPQLAQR